MRRLFIIAFFSLPVGIYAQPEADALMFVIKRQLESGDTATAYQNIRIFIPTYPRHLFFPLAHLALIKRFEDRGDEDSIFFYINRLLSIDEVDWVSPYTEDSAKLRTFLKTILTCKKEGFLSLSKYYYRKKDYQSALSM